MKRRLLAVLLAAAMAMTAAGCGNNSSEDSGKAESGKEDSGTDEKESESSSDEGTDTGYSDRKVTLVTAGTGEPYTLLADDGTWTGIDAEMWAEIEKSTGWGGEVKQAAFDAMWGELDTARADVVANCTAVKPERVEKYNATIPYYGDAQCVIVNNSSSYKTVQDLKGKVVGCTNGQAAQTIIEDLGAEIGFEVKLYEDSAVGMNDLMLERIDAYANTTTNVNAFSHNNEGADFRFFEENLMANNVAYFLTKTDEGAALRDELNKVLQEMLDDGTIAKITEKWMYADMTQLIQE